MLLFSKTLGVLRCTALQTTITKCYEIHYNSLSSNNYSQKFDSLGWENKKYVIVSQSNFMQSETIPIKWNYVFHRTRWTIQHIGDVE